MHVDTHTREPFTVPVSTGNEQQKQFVVTRDASILLHNNVFSLEFSEN